MAQQRLIISPDQIVGDTICLTSTQQHYLGRVLRLGPGDRFLALDGQGHQWQAALGVAGKIAEVLATLASGSSPGDVQLTLVAALPKGNAFDEVVRQATELGVSTIQPVISQRTLLQPSPQKLERWRRIAAEATEQSERLTVPEVRSPLIWKDWLGAEDTKPGYLCVARGDVPHLLTCVQASWESPLTVMVGPEGGWTDAEIAGAIAAGWQPVSLGPSVLRAVTAAIAALTLVRGAIDTVTPRTTAS